jgi:hypothetical protein
MITAGGIEDAAAMGADRILFDNAMPSRRASLLNRLAEN